MKHTPNCERPEPVLLRLHREDDGNAALNCEEERERREQQTAAEEFWAGRNHAMRQSARVAA